MSDTSLVFNLVARDRTGETLSRVRERFDTAAAGIGAGVAGALGVGVAASLDMSAASSKLAAQLGIGPEKAAELSKVSASVYANAWGDSIQTVDDAIRGVYQNIGDVSQVEGGLEGITTKALALADTFDQEVGPTTAAVGQMLKTGLAKNADEAFDILTRGFQTGANKADDLLDTVNEYGTQWRKFGLDGKTAMGLLSQGLKGGARDADLVADSIKEFSIRAVDGSTTTAQGFKAIGLSADDMATRIGKGGSSAASALDITLDRLRGIKDPVAQSQAAVQLFGTQAEDLGAALYSLDPSSAVDALGKVGGAADKMAKTVGDTPASALESFKRKAVTKLAEVSGTFIQFATENQGVFQPLVYTLMGLAGTVLVVRAAMVTYSTISAVVAGANAIISASAWTVIGNWMRMMGIGLMAYLRIAAGAVASALTTAAAWTGSALVSIGTWVLAVIRAAVVSGAQFLLMAARAVAWAAVMAAQWLIAMGPVGWVIAIVVGLVILIIAKWDLVKKYTLMVWDWVWKKIQAAAGFILSGVKRLGALPGLVLGYFIKMHLWAIQKAWDLVKWMAGLPGRIGKAVASLNNLLVSKGVAVVQGLWRGISSMGGWIKSKLIGWAKSAIPGPIAKALGIASPSKVTTAQGRWIARGLIVGLTGSTKQVKAAATKLADIVRDAMAPGKKKAKALATINSGTSQLMKLANHESAVAAKLKSANKHLADLIKSRDKLAADVKKGVLDAANITQNTSGGPVTGDTILTSLQTKLAQAKQFAANLAQLRKKGVRGDLIAQIAQAGVEGGSAAATALATADKGTIKQINATQGQLVSAAGQAGSAAGEAMYGAGINAAQGIVKGLQKEQKAIEKQMLKIAEGMSEAIKKALGIHSPSTLMADEVGRFIPPGVVKGMQQTAPQLDAAMRQLVRPELSAPRPRPLTGMAPQMGAQSGGVTVLVRFETGRGEDDFHKLMRKITRVQGRGNVQVAFGQ
ncbi:phage tail tape measure protein [Streptomyces sp. NPDC002520]